MAAFESLHFSMLLSMLPFAEFAATATQAVFNAERAAKLHKLF
jgi:hypothetical protein